MGSFSFLRADKTTKRNNLTMGDSYKILVPDVYGGGYIKDKYFDYGYINYGKDHAVYVDKNKHMYELTGVTADLYGVLAYWNNPEMVENLKGKGMPDMLRILLFGDTCDQPIRCRGIDIGCYNDQIDKLEYPLKLVSASYKGTYEGCDMRSYGDPNQGFYKTYWGVIKMEITKESLKKLNHYDLIDILKVYAQEQRTDCNEYMLVYSEVIRRMVNGERAERGIGAMTPEEEKEFGF